jgi:hypothetical protein
MKPRRPLDGSSTSKSLASRILRTKFSFAFAAGLGVWLPTAYGEVIIDLDSTQLSLGPLQAWPNSGTVGGEFTSAGVTTPEVSAILGVRGVTLVGADTHYVGPNTTLAAQGNRSRSVEAWIYDDAPQDGGVIISWARRGGPDGSNGTLLHGTNPAFGAVGQWGAGDMGWNERIAFGRWTHIAYSFDATTQKGTVYFDGKIANTKEFAPGVINAHATDEAGNPVPFRLGRQTTAAGLLSGADLPSNITVGRVRMHDVALTDEQIRAKFLEEKPSFEIDSDGDGAADWFEVLHALNPNDPADGALDTDSDGLSNAEEFRAGANPTLPDTDGDGIADAAEVNRKVNNLAAPTDPAKADTDEDGLGDAVETGSGTFTDASNTGTDPLKKDTDGDGFEDGREVASFTNPTDSNSFPRADRGPFVELDATTLEAGPLTEWQNTGPLGGSFVAAEGAAANIETIDGVNGVNLDGGVNYYTGPAVPSVLTGDSARSIEAWVYNPAAADEETIVAWGRRGGGDGTNLSFNHGTNPAYGAVGHWGAPDLGWDGKLAVGRWTYVVYTYNPVNKTTSVYSDGELASSEVSGPLNTWGVDTAGQPLPFRIGSQNEANGTPTPNLRGSLSLARLRIYDRVLDSTFIRSKFSEERPQLWADTDRDGIPDWYELRYSFLDLNAAGDAVLDGDNDGLNNLGEFRAGTLADNPDSDGDGLTDGAEVNRQVNNQAAPTDPLKFDTDGDGLGDRAETGTGLLVDAQNAGSDPLKSDSDGDSFDDFREVANGADPNKASSTPSQTRGPIVDVDASALELGTQTEWVNQGPLGGSFVAPQEAPGVVEEIAGMRGLTLDGSATFYTGPSTPPFIAGNNARSIDAWMFNPALADEETIVAWGRRGGPDGSNLSFNHGANTTFGAVGHWGGADVGWSGRVVAGRWTHVAYSYDPQSRTAKVFSEGSVATTKVTGALNTWVLDTAQQPLPIRIGSQNEDNGAPTTALRGSMTIGRLRIYDRTLSDGEVKGLFSLERKSYSVPNDLTLALGPTPAEFTLQWVPVDGLSYEVQQSSNLVDWTPLASGITAGSYTGVRTPEATGPQFYRLVVQ